MPNIVEKIQLPKDRNLYEARNLWGEFINVKKPSCVFTNMLIKEPFAVDHFLPWTFMCHDELWNLAPLSQSLNSSKSNQLPHKKYVSPFAVMQWRFLQYYLGKNNFEKTGKIAEVYIRDLRIDTKILPESFIAEPNVQFLNAYAEMYEPYFSMARRMGFKVDWEIENAVNKAAEDKAPYGK